MCIESFGGDITPMKSIIPYTGLKLWLTIKFLQRVIKQETWGQGIGRHTPEEVWLIAVHDLTAISDYLGNNDVLASVRNCIFTQYSSEVDWFKIIIRYLLDPCWQTII